MVRDGGPQRLQRRRRRGWRMPDGAVYVGRPTIWGNPFLVTRSSDYHGLPGSWFVRAEDGSLHHPHVDTQTAARRTAVDLYAQHVVHDTDARVTVSMIRSQLAGRDLVCWCPRDEPCHADFLLAVANSRSSEPAISLAGVVEPSVTEGCPTCGGRHPRSSCPTCGSGIGLTDA